MHRGLAFSIAIASCAIAQSVARAQGMNDPMRPSTHAESAAPDARPAASGLRVVITSPQRKLALIDGGVVPLGAVARGGTLAGMSDSAAVLRKNGEYDVLFMHPNIEKRARRGAP